ncbi:lysophospholipid acyltransferase family protein [Sulfuricystis thermophila]|uniref:lysophospholipid acyltransferase family protein n=1 Tax=Sulfuricystis thermophila TaxID=2496847 RepID=UPI0024DFE460|nr:lysophospholipid acyltransferase family protein [Sulfuricystis thermophila]
MLRELRTAFRITRVGLHLGWGAATVAVVYPWLDDRWRRALKRRWSRQLLEMLGVKLGAGDTAPPPGLIVCNHISWLDIFVINAITPAAFVAKAEVKDWPLIGWLCARTETLFLERGSRTSARRTIEAMVVRLKRGIHVAVFPEGTTTAGEHVLRFMPRCSRRRSRHKPKSYPLRCAMPISAATRAGQPPTSATSRCGNVCARSRGQTVWWRSCVCCTHSNRTTVFAVNWRDNVAQEFSCISKVVASCRFCQRRPQRWAKCPSSKCNPSHSPQCPQ